MPDMLVRLYDLPSSVEIVDRLAKDGIIIRNAMAYEHHVLIPWVRDNFNDAWSDECRAAFQHQPVSCCLATHQGKLIGFGCYECTARNFFGPTGVLESWRGRGIGKALLLYCLEAMAAMGYGYAIIGGAGPTEFYAHAAGAEEILQSSPGIYRDQLTAET